MRKTLLPAVAAVFLFGFEAVRAEIARVEELYRLHCAACHGDRLDGGLGGSLIDGNWLHGATDEEIRKVIADGLPDLGMEGFSKTLTPEQIRTLVIYIREKEHEEALRKNPPVSSSIGGLSQTQRESYRTELVADGLSIPWSLAFLPDGSYLVTERPGALRRISPSGEVSEPIEGTPRSIQRGQGGMMEVALHPDFEENGWIYLGFADGEPDERRPRVMTKVVRGKIEGNRWVSEELIWESPPEFLVPAGAHFGTRFVFHDGYLWFAIGDRGNPPTAQDLSSPNGNIFRLHDDGRIPEDNPFVGVEGALPEIWSYGHRNPQGLVRHPETGLLFNTEHGPRGGDELNLVLPGKNYGWPVITHGMNYNGTPVTALTAKDGMEQPVLQWTPSIAACGLDVSPGGKFPSWQNDLFAGGLATQEVRRIRLKEDGSVDEEEIVVKGMGRIRDVRFRPDGALYLVLNGPDCVVRLVPEGGKD
jgi:glucose/arabinose dehydrogenase